MILIAITSTARRWYYFLGVSSSIAVEKIHDNAKNDHMEVEVMLHEQC